MCRISRFIPDFKNQIGDAEVSVKFLDNIINVSSKLI